jgi:hypothetical protein
MAMGYEDDPLGPILAKSKLEEITEEDREVVHKHHKAERTRILRADLA